MLFTLIVEGNVAATPTLRHTDTGIPVCELRLLRNNRYRNGKGEWVDGKTMAIDVCCWRDLAVRAAKLRKGDTVIAECGDDLHAEAYGQRATVRATAHTLAISMRYADASSHRQPKPDRSGDIIVTADGEHLDAADLPDREPAPVG